MEKYANKNTIVKNQVYELFKDSIICPICDEVMIEPVICLNCQNSYCKTCIEKNKEKGELCFNKCENPIIKDIIDKNNYISKFKFKCIKGCGEEISFNDIEKHYSIECLSKENKNNNKNKLKIIDAKEAANYKKNKGGDTPSLCSM
jgi:hypothetical protein